MAPSAQRRQVRGRVVVAPTDGMSKAPIPSAETAVDQNGVVLALRLTQGATQLFSAALGGLLLGGAWSESRRTKAEQERAARALYATIRSQREDFQFTTLMALQ